MDLVLSYANGISLYLFPHAKGQCLLHNFKELEITRSFGKHDPSSVYFEF